MKRLDVLNKTWRVGDTIEVTKEQMDSLVDAGLYESYDQSYQIGDLKWKVTHRVANPDGSTVYTLTAVDEA